MEIKVIKGSGYVINQISTRGFSNLIWLRGLGLLPEEGIDMSVQIKEGLPITEVKTETGTVVQTRVSTQLGNLFLFPRGRFKEISSSTVTHNASFLIN